MSAETAINIIENELHCPQLNQEENLIVHFMGGEPFLNFDVIRKTCEWVRSESHISRVSLSATTNGTLLSKHREWLWENRDIFKPVLSADGDSLMQDANRSHSSEMIDFDFYVKTWPDGKVKMTISPQTVRRVADGVKYIHSIGISRIDANLALGKDVGWNLADLKAYQNQLQKLISFYLQNPDIKPVSMLDMDITRILDKKDIAKRCGCGENLVCYDSDGAVYPCQLFSPVSLNINQVKECKGINFKDKSLFVSQKCKSCALRNVCATCPGMNYQYTHSVAKVPGVFCHASKIEFHTTCLLLYNRLRLNQDVANKMTVERALKYYNKILNTIKI